jgi:Dolichyl-phosphate-mannose-protein mannosyltransferase
VHLIVPLMVFGTLGVAVAFLTGHSIAPEERRWVVRTMLLALSLRLTVAFVFEMFPVLRIFHEDASGYEGAAVRMALAWGGRYPPYELSGTNTGFYWLGGLVCYLFGPYPLNVPMMNGVIGTATVFLIYRLGRQFFHVAVCRFATRLVAYVPSMILWSAIALKDALMTFLIVWALSGCVSLKRHFSVKAFVGTAIPLAAMQPIRFYMVYFVAFAIVAALLIEPGLRVMSGMYKQLSLAAVAVGLFMLTGISQGAVTGSEFLDLQRVSTFRSGMATSAKSGFSADVDISTPARAMAFLPIGMANLLLAPFPWQMTSLRPLIAAPEVIAWWILFPSVLRGLALVVRRRFSTISPLVIFSGALTCAYSLIHGNVGSAFRQRAQIFVFLFLFAALGWYQAKCKRSGVNEELLLLPPR